MLDPLGSSPKPEPETRARATVIAIFHATVKAFSRGQGHSATAAAAYRAGLKIADDRTGLVHDYTRRKGVSSVDQLAPEGSPDWCRDPAAFWNANEKAETRANARVAREVEISLPAELDADQRHALAVDLGRMLVERFGVAALVAVHAPDAGGDERNHHTHILLSARKVGPDGLGGRAMAVFDARQGAGKDAVRDLRAAVADRINAHLSAAGVADRVDHRSLATQAKAAEASEDLTAAILLTRAPTVHEGKAATAAGRRGETLDRAAENIAIRLDNAAFLRDYLAAAEVEGRLMPTPAGQAEQAQTDLARETSSKRIPDHEHSKHRVRTLDRAGVDASRVRLARDGGKPLFEVRSLDRAPVGVSAERGGKHRGFATFGDGGVLRSHEQGHHRTGEALHIVQRETLTPVKAPLDAVDAGNRKRQTATGPVVPVSVQGYVRMRGGKPERVAGHARQQHSAVRTVVGQGTGRASRATGAGAGVLNMQAALSAEGAAVAAGGSQAYIDKLAETARMGQAIIDAYIRMLRLATNDADALAAHCRRDRWCAKLLERSLEARDRVERAEGRPLRRRKAHGQAMVATGEARTAVDTLDAAKPSAWRPLTRREWAERRRQAGTVVEQAERAERKARRAVGSKAMARYAVEETAARSAWDGIERERRARFPIPMDSAKDMAMVNAAVELFLKGVNENGMADGVDDLLDAMTPQTDRGRGTGKRSALRPR